MADDAKNNPSRSQTDKDRSRQQSRSVNARQVGRQSAGSSGRGARNSGTGPSTRAKTPTKTSKGNKNGDGRQADQRSGRATTSGRGARPNRPAGSGGGRSATALLTWGIVAVVLVVVIVLVAVKVFGGSTTGSSNAVQPGPVPASVLKDVTHVPASVFAAVGVTSPQVTVNPPRVEKNQPAYTTNGKPTYFFMGGEYCPYCAAERWAVIAALSRFGTLSGLQTMQSSSTDLAPNTQTFTFAHAKYTSPYVATVLKEVYSNQLTSTGRGYKTLESLTKKQAQLATRYDVTPSTSSSSGRSIPFSDIDNKVIFSGASYSPMILQSLTRQQIAQDLSDPHSAVTQAIITTANYISAGICSVDGGKPGAVCTTKGVQAAAKALGLSI